jgi:Zn-finger nucleic acid-binding protein
MLHQRSSAQTSPEEDWPMNCPRCSQELKAIEYEGLGIETCPGCQGEWLDAGELLGVTQRMGSRFAPEEIEKLEAINKAIFTLEEQTPQVDCPRCPDTPLKRFNYAVSSGIALDKCPRCAGVWLDKGEMEQVQILAEQWKGKLSEDLKAYSNRLSLVDEVQNAEVDRSVSVSRFFFINMLLRLCF